MKKYSSKRAQKGKIAYRTPSQFIYKRTVVVAKSKIKRKDYTDLKK